MHTYIHTYIHIYMSHSCIDISIYMNTHTQHSTAQHSTAHTQHTHTHTQAHTHPYRSQGTYHRRMRVSKTGTSLCRPSTTTSVRSCRIRAGTEGSPPSPTICAWTAHRSHLHRDGAQPSHICHGTGLTPPTSALKPGSPPPTSAPGLRTPLPPSLVPGRGSPPPTSAPGLRAAAHDDVVLPPYSMAAYPESPSPDEPCQHASCVTSPRFHPPLRSCLRVPCRVPVPSRSLFAAPLLLPFRRVP
jgi:hypothetical protein